MKKTKHHRGSLKSSERQQKLLKATRRGRWYSAMDLTRLTGLPNCAEVISALRLNGVKIEKRPIPGEKCVQWKIG